MEESGDEIRDEIVRLEGEIEALAETLEHCRKIILLAKIAMAAGGVAIIVLLLGLVSFDLLPMILGFSAVIGGIVAYGSNISTAQQAAENLKAAETERAALIDASRLRVVGGTASGLNGSGANGRGPNGSSALTSR
jgi:hypothetical protein